MMLVKYNTFLESIDIQERNSKIVIFFVSGKDFKPK